jgi:hypothetical protein
MKTAKVCILGILAAGSWIAAWMLLKEIIYQNKSLIFIGWPSLAVILGIIFLTFFFLVNKNRIISAVLNSIIFLGYLAVMPKEFYVILGGAVLLVFLWLFEQRLTSEEKSRLDFSIRRVMSGSMSVIVYPLLLLIGLNIYYNTQVDFKSNPDAYYQKLADAAAKTAPYVTQSFNQLTPQQKQDLANQVASQAVNQIKQSASGYQQYFPFLFALIVTATLWTFAFILRWAALIVGWILFRILAAAGFFRLEPQMVEVQKLIV